MADVLVPVGRHFLTPDYIKQLADDIKPEDVGEHGIAVKFGVDNDGARIAAIFTPKGDHFALRTAYAWDKEKGHTFGVDGGLKW